MIHDLIEKAFAVTMDSESDHVPGPHSIAEKKQMSIPAF